MTRPAGRVRRPGSLAATPKGSAEYPVGGISWFEAAAYARIRRQVAADACITGIAPRGADEIYSDMLRLSNFDGKGPGQRRRRAGVGPWGTLDMAGNVKEWCLERIRAARDCATSSAARWNEPGYRFREPEARGSVGSAAETFGMRLVKNLGPADRRRRDPSPASNGDPQSARAGRGRAVRGAQGFYAYDRAPLDARVEAVDDSSPYWRKETVSFAAAYGGERVPAYLFLPKNAKPPYQTVRVLPELATRRDGAVEHASWISWRSSSSCAAAGRCSTRSTKARSSGGGRQPPGRARVRDMHVPWAKDFFRAVDYLETRPDLDISDSAYYSLSMGAFYGPIPVALEPRIKAGGLCRRRAAVQLPAGDPAGQLHAAGEGAGSARERPG